MLSLCLEFFLWNLKEGTFCKLLSGWMFTGDQYCGGRLMKPSGTFKTPNWPEKDYPAGVTCSWHIVAPKKQVDSFIHFHITVSIKFVVYSFYWMQTGIIPQNVFVCLQIIEVKFEKFDVERDNYCRYDYVAIFNGGEINDAKRIGKYCGDSPPAYVSYHSY